MKNGIILAGGTGSRLYPLTHVVNKHLLGVNGKFIIDYPINTLKQMGVENITVIMGGNHFSQVVSYLQDGSRYGVNFNYVYQGEPKGIAHAINLCKRLVADQNEFTVVLGDNIFEKPIHWANEPGSDKAQIALCHHGELHRFGVSQIDLQTNKIVNIIEKPTALINNYKYMAITGCYSFTQEYFDFFETIQPSARGEYEITDILMRYLVSDKLVSSEVTGLWSDAGTHESIAYVNNYFHHKNKSTDIE